MVKAISDRLAEATAEKLHQIIREKWGFPDDEDMSHERLMKADYRSIRPAFGYPACPDHSDKRSLFALLDANPMDSNLLNPVLLILLQVFRGYTSVTRKRNTSVSTESMKGKSWTWLNANARLDVKSSIGWHPLSTMTQIEYSIFSSVSAKQHSGSKERKH